MNELANVQLLRASTTSRFPALPVSGLAGASFKPAHLPSILTDSTRIGFFEVHAENYMGDGGPAHHALARIRHDHPISLHGVCMSIGGPQPLDKAHLGRFKSLVDRYEPALVSEHLAWSTHGSTFYNDLLPLPYTKTTLSLVADHIDEVQETIGRPILLENPSTYVLFAQSTMSETDFLRDLVRRTGCDLLLDVSNVFVSATNHRRSALEYLADFPLGQVGEIHLAGHAEQRDDGGKLLLIDSHDGPVADAVWKLYDVVIHRCGAVPTLVEWDSDVPDWPILKAEATAAQAILDRHRRTECPERLAPAISSELQPPGDGIDFAGGFAASLLDPGLEPPPFVSGPDGEAAGRRYDVYRNDVIVSLVDALAAAYPATMRITGRDFFRAMARNYVRATPPTSPLLFEYGHGFAKFIEKYEHARSMPWLADVARIERAWLDACHAADAEPLKPDALASIPPEQLSDTVLMPHPAARVVRSRYPAVTIFTANRGDAPMTRIESDEPEDALVTRPGLEVAIRQLPAGGATFVTQLMGGQPFGVAAATAFAGSPEFDLPDSIAGILEAGAFTAASQGG